MSSRLQSNSTSKESGFTLIEMIGVLAIIAILSGSAAPLVFDAIEDARYQQAKVNMHTIKVAMFSFATDCGVWPGRHEGLSYLNSTGATVTAISSTAMCSSGKYGNLADYLINNTKNYRGWRGPYISEVPEDPWGFQYTVNVGGLFGLADDNVWVLSPGPDGKCSTIRTSDTVADDDVALLFRRNRAGSSSISLAQESTTSAVQTVNLTTIQGPSILGLTPTQIAQLSPVQIAMMSAADFNKLTLEQKAVLTQTQVDERAFADGVRGMKLWQFGEITTSQAKYLTVEQIATVPHDWWFNKIPQASRDAMSKEQIQAFIPNALKNARVGTLTAEQRDWLTPTQVQGLTQDNFQYLSINQFTLVTTEQIATVPHDWWFNKIPQATRDSMTQTQVQAFDANAFKNGGVATLTPTQRDWLTPIQIQGLTQDNFKTLSSNQFTQVTAQQVASIPNDWWFNQLPQATRNIMTQTQVNAIPASYYAKIKASLTAQQQSWRP